MTRSAVRTATVLFLLLATAMFVAPSGADELRDNLFSGADFLMEQGKEARADVLSPKSWNSAMARYESAERKLVAGKNLDDIRKDLGEAAQYFRSAIKATDIARVTLATVLKSRDDAAKVDAAQNATELWGQATDKFIEAGTKLEDGNVNSARKKGGEAEALFRDAELSAIKTSFFDETRRLLAQADDDKVEKYAPKTLDYARSLLTQAETALNENRYDTDKPRSLAMDAKSEALHALHVAKLVRLVEDKTMTREDLILDGEKPFAQIAGALDVQVGFEEGFARPTDVIVTAIESREAANDQLRSEVHDRDDRIASLSDQVGQLESNLGGASQAEAELQAQIAAQQVASQHFSTVEQMFSREEARVLREGGNVIIRLVGMDFSSGQAVIRPEHFALLTKVKNAIGTYPGASISIEGHTDAYGTDDANLGLSQQRAEAVAQYLLANSSLTAGRVQAVGFGETRPVASNETMEGRTKNRRIDIVLKQVS